MIKRWNDLKSRSAKWKQCEPYYALLYDWTKVGALWRGMYSWDLYDMTHDWAKNMKGANCGSCIQTVTVGGRCYNAWDVNYYSFGLICEKCGLSYMDIRKIITMWKMLPTKWSDDKEAAIAFAQYGFMEADANKIYVSVEGNLNSACGACSEKYPSTLSSLWPVAVDSQ
jgi:hypothetical protein